MSRAVPRYKEWHGFENFVAGVGRAAPRREDAPPSAAKLHCAALVALCGIVLLGYEHPDLVEIQASSPTLSRLGRPVVFQWAAQNRARLECADAKSASLQGDGEEMQEQKPIFALALDEMAIALGIPLGSAAKILKAVYGLPNAPRS